MDFYGVVNCFRDFYREKFWPLILEGSLGTADDGGNLLFHLGSSFSKASESCLLSETEQKFLSLAYLNVEIADFEADSVMGRNWVYQVDSRTIGEIRINSKLFLRSFNRRRDKEHLKAIASHEFLECMHMIIRSRTEPIIYSKSRTLKGREAHFAQLNLFTGQNAPWVDQDSYLEKFRGACEDILVSQESIKRLCSNGCQTVENLDDLRERHFAYLNPYSDENHNILREVSEEISKNLNVKFDLVFKRLKDVVESLD